MRDPIPPNDRSGAKPSLFEVGDRVLIVGNLELRGATGVVVNSTGKVFNGWNICLEKTGLHVGVATCNLVRVEE